ncbi:bestrophin family ion channel [Novosphingobium sp. PS1R-30]|uniref:Bestrophin family ion channel n=1 Tax=Novosphingobium anseongense TaxID=3133436 RepID=A0ABU8S064_9SPHN
MIVKATPSLKQIVREVWRPLMILFVWDVLVTVAYYRPSFSAPELPLTLFGSVLALFLGFRSNSAYQRWWEARSLWGLMINASRSLARGVRNFMPDPAAAPLKREIVRRQIAYVNALRCQLRRQAMDEDIGRFIEDPVQDPALGRVNVANGLLDGTGRRIADVRAKGWIDSIQQTQIEAVLVDIANAQGGMERIKNTPLPVHYRFFPTLFTHLFCILLPFGLVETLGLATPLGSTVAGLMFLAVLAIGDDLAEPFDNRVHDLPLSAMCRTIEIDLLEAIGDAPRPPLQADKYGVLW